MKKQPKASRGIQPKSYTLRWNEDFGRSRPPTTVSPGRQIQIFVSRLMERISVLSKHEVNILARPCCLLILASIYLASVTVWSGTDWLKNISIASIFLWVVWIEYKKLSGGEKEGFK